MKLTTALLSTAILVIAAAAYIAINVSYKEEDAAFDLHEEDESVYL
ncbi:hypothetical protein [Pontibacter chitinilyticus]